MTRTQRTLGLAYGHGLMAVRLPTGNLLGVLNLPPLGQPPDEEGVVCQALAHPVGTPRLRDLVRPGEQVVIVTSDLTRPCPTARLLPVVLSELQKAGIQDQEITVVMAVGLHRPMTDAEIEMAVGPAVSGRFNVVNHDPLDVTRLGTTSLGTSVELFRPLVEADRRVCLGNTELHWFAGYSGGAKAILPGCASRATVQANHALMTQTGAAPAALERNPVRADLEEGAAMLGVDFILNVVMDGDHRIVAAVAGEVTAAHRRACEWVARRGITPIGELADLVLVSAGGYPKDLNLYQAQKALDNAARAVRPGGIVILAAECREGFGNQTFEKWMMNASSPNEILERIQREFVLGGHKAAGFASVLKRARVYLVSRMPDNAVRRCGMVPFPDVYDALSAALAEAGPDARILAMPQGGAILPQPPAV